MLAVVAAVLAFPPAGAEPGNGCVAGSTGGGLDEAGTCSYESTGAATQLVVATPNLWTVTARVGNQTRVLAAGGPLSPPMQTTVNVRPRERVTVTIGPDCVPSTPVCGWIGTVSVFESE